MASSKLTLGKWGFCFTGEKATICVQCPGLETRLLPATIPDGSGFLPEVALN